MRVKAEANYGAYVSMFAPTIPTTGMAKVISGLYRIPAIRLDFDCAFTNTVPVDAIRGAGKPEALFLLERLVDIARTRPAARRSICAASTCSRPRTCPTRRRAATSTTPRTAAAVRDGPAAADVPGFDARRAASEAAGKRRGIGLPAICTAPAASPTSMSWSRSSPTGWSRGRHAEPGPGPRDGVRPAPSQALGVPIERIEVRQGDTRTIPHGGGTGGSSSTIISGTTLKRAADVVIQRGRDLAAERLETAPADIAYRDGPFEVVGTDRRARPVRACRRSRSRAMRCSPTRSSPSRPASWSARSRSIPTPARSRIDRFTAVADAGAVVNPLLLAGQMHGGIVHGLGNALMEEAVYDEETGQLLTGTLMDYALPRADDVPDLHVETIATLRPTTSWA